MGLLNGLVAELYEERIGANASSKGKAGGSVRNHEGRSLNALIGFLEATNTSNEGCFWFLQRDSARSVRVVVDDLHVVRSFELSICTFFENFAEEQSLQCSPIFLARAAAHPRFETARDSPKLKSGDIVLIRNTISRLISSYQHKASSHIQEPDGHRLMHSAQKEVSLSSALLCSTGLGLSLRN